MHRHFCSIRTKPELVVHVPKSCSVVPPVTEEVYFTTLSPDKHLQANNKLNQITALKGLHLTCLAGISKLM